MADTKISDLVELAEPPNPVDEFVVVDKSDTGMATSGTDKRLKATWLIPGDSSTTLKGVTKLSVAPVSGTNPIAVGDNDPRNSNARTPTTHTHPQSDVTSLVTDLALISPINVKRDFGAVGDGVADDQPEIQAAIDYALSSGVRGDVYIPPGTYLLGAPLTVQGVGISLVGRQGELTSILKASHSAGPVVQVKDRRDGLRNLQIDATAGRTAGAAGSGAGNCGVLIEATDAASTYSQLCLFDNIVIKNQPSQGMVAIAGIWLSRFNQMTITANKGHGLIFDYGSLTSRTNTQPPGISTIANSQIFDNDGHGVLIGNDDSVSNRGIRLRFENCDIYRNASAAGGGPPTGRKSADQVWCFGDHCTFTNGAFDGMDKATATTPTTRGILMYGKNNAVRQYRFLNVTAQIARMGDAINFGGTGNGMTTEGNAIEDFWIQGSAQADLDPAVTIDAGVLSARVNTQPQTHITRLVTTSASQRDCLRHQVRMAVKPSAESRTSTTTLADDADLFIPVNKNEYVTFRATIFHDGLLAGSIKIAFTVPASSTLRWGPSNGIKVDESDALVIQPTVTSGSMNFGCGGVGTVRPIEISGQLITAGTAGNLQLQFAQVASSGTATRIFGQSFLQVIR